MPWRNGPHARASGDDADRERLPRAIAARLKSAGCIAEVPAATTATARRTSRGSSRAGAARPLVARGLRADRVAPLRGRRRGALRAGRIRDALAGARRRRRRRHLALLGQPRRRRRAGQHRPVQAVDAPEGRRQGSARAARRDGAARHRSRPVRDDLRLHRRRARVRRRQRHRPARRRRPAAPRSRRARPKQQQALLRVAFDGDWWRPTCASCGIKLVERTARQSGRAFWGCENFVRGCKTQMAMRL